MSNYISWFYDTDIWGRPCNFTSFALGIYTTFFFEIYWSALYAQFYAYNYSVTRYFTLRSVHKYMFNGS